MSNEQEIDLNTGNVVGSDKNASNEANQPEDNKYIPGYSKQSRELAELSKKMTNEEFVNALAAAPVESLIKFEECEIPSRGIYYEGWSNGIIKVKPMTQSVEKVFANKRLASTGQAIDIMFSKCVDMPGDMDPSQLLVGDRTFLLYYIRCLTYGNLYKFGMSCPRCEAQSVHTYDMNELYTTVRFANRSLGNEPFRVDLPYLSETTGREVWADVRFLRSYDINDIMNKQKFNKRLTNTSVRQANRSRQPHGPDQAEHVLDKSLEKMVVGINGIMDPGVIYNVVSKLHSRDNAAIRQFLLDHTPGIDTTVTIECPECQNEVTMELPISDSFFRSVK